MNVYFVSFAHDDGFGNIEIKFNGEINKYEQLEALTKVIEERNPLLSNVVILNYIPLSKKENKERKELYDR